MEMLEISPASADRGSIPPTDLAGVSECAKAVGVNKSTISRQLSRGLFKNWGTTAAPKVSIAEVKAARADDLSPSHQHAPVARKAAVEKTGYAHERGERERINRQRDEIALGEKLKTILDRAQVEDDFETFARSLRERLRQRAPTLALELEQLPTLAAREARIIESDEALLAELADELEGQAGAAGN